MRGEMRRVGRWKRNDIERREGGNREGGEKHSRPKHQDYTHFLSWKRNKKGLYDRDLCSIFYHILVFSLTFLVFFPYLDLETCVLLNSFSLL